MHRLALSPDLKLPREAVTQTFAFLARRGAGKTYAAGKLVEEMYDADAQVVVIDPIGNWWGLRLAADGKSPGIPIAVFGGERGDIPLEAGAGALVADLVVDRGISTVLDVSGFRKHQRKEFVTAFAEQLFHRKKSTRTPLHVVLEEAHMFVPQRVQHGEERMLGALEDVIRLGRNYGIGASLISQRPQAVNKDVLNQTEVLVVLQTTGPQERKAIEGWISEKGAESDAVEELPSLPPGTAWIWSPQWLGVFKKVKIGTKRTYDASATPVLGGRAEKARELAPVELDRIREAMKETIAKAEESDPKALRRRIAQLEKERQPQTKTETVRVEVPVIDAATMKGIDALIDRLTAAVQDVAGVGRLLEKVSSSLATLKRPAIAPSAVARPTNGAHGHAAPRATPARPARAVAQGDDDRALPRGETATLAALIQYPSGLRREQLTVLTGYKRSSRDAYIQRLREKGFAETSGDAVRATDAGAQHLPNATPLPRGVELQSYWLARLPLGERAVLEQLLGAYPNTVSRHAIDEATGYQRSSRDAYLARLRAKELVRIESGEPRASDVLFE